MKAALLFAGLALVPACSGPESKASKDASKLGNRERKLDVRNKLGKPHSIRYVAPNVEEWRYTYSEEARMLFPGEEPTIRWDGPPAPYLVIRVENGEVVSWRRPSR